MEERKNKMINFGYAPSYICDLNQDTDGRTVGRLASHSIQTHEHNCMYFVTQSKGRSTQPRERKEIGSLCYPC